MSAASAAILEGMPDPRDLYRLDSGGETAVFAGTAELGKFPVRSYGCWQAADSARGPVRAGTGTDLVGELR